MRFQKFSPEAQVYLDRMIDLYQSKKLTHFETTQLFQDLVDTGYYLQLDEHIKRFAKELLASKIIVAPMRIHHED